MAEPLRTVVAEITGRRRAMAAGPHGKGRPDMGRRYTRKRIKTQGFGGFLMPHDTTSEQRGAALKTFAMAWPTLRLSVIAVASATLLVACGDSKDKPATQSAARVNKEEITVHQINYVLQQQRGLKTDQVETASKQVLERLIDQELALQKAGEIKIDRDPRVMQQLEAARREIVARAYFDKVADGAAKPTPEEVKKYYDEHPELFSQRRVYQLQEVMIEAPAEKLPELRERLQAAKDVGEFVQYLRAQDIKFTGNQAVRAAEQIPLGSLAGIAKMKDGQAAITAVPNGIQVLVVAGSRSQPVDLERARPAIEQFLLSDAKRKVVADDLKALRGAAKVEYLGKYAQGAAPEPAPAPVAPPPPPPPAPIVIEPPAPQASGPLETSTINKGLGLK
ncbi:EpsD family peptidyl-prolyl cis-trans isomerase [Aquabacterium sp. J223]|uniref:EpsD family peptidyl-prolyl cis-trans isomerase n=1 Tax=Aquabacterium sp. J223 TaxID=2898431 RepID=UPI0021AE0380|nr:EpsD family peptidyl-prolyl cis-trans isomerase [Aquabacterium sp. J223]UUX96846.1 EpsD family peptidyl-prolyl cis-trans isomerase [Aquabacterium sp. J223]